MHTISELDTFCIVARGAYGDRGAVLVTFDHEEEQTHLETADMDVSQTGHGAMADELTNEESILGKLCITARASYGKRGAVFVTFDHEEEQTYLDVSHTGHGAGTA